MKRFSIATVAAVAFVLSVFLAGCGDSGGGGIPEEGTPRL